MLLKTRARKPSSPPGCTVPGRGGDKPRTSSPLDPLSEATLILNFNSEGPRTNQHFSSLIVLVAFTCQTYSIDAIMRILGIFVLYWTLLGMTYLLHLQPRIADFISSLLVYAKKEEIVDNYRIGRSDLLTMHGGSIGWMR